MSDDLIGRQLDSYVIVEEIGRGGMGVVYKARDQHLDRSVALKIMAPHLAWDEGFVQRFHHEARAAANLMHRHCVTIYEVGHSENLHFIAMEYLPGKTVAELIKERGAFPPEEAARLIMQVADALDYAHARGFIHRDVKPPNVIVSPWGHATLTDFGLVKAIAGTRLTRTGSKLGTPAYMSPEQIRGEKLTVSTDIYNLGIVAYELTTSKLPFHADSSAAVMYQQVHLAPVSPSDLQPEVPKAVSDVIAVALAKNPADRWPSAGSMARAMQAAIAGQSMALPSTPSYRSGDGGGNGSRFSLEATGLLRKLRAGLGTLLSGSMTDRATLWPILGAFVALALVATILIMASM